MPVVPAMVAIGTALGASAATAATVGTIATVSTVGAVGLKTAALVKANSAAKASQGLALDTANYNAKVDEAAATQDELDATANIEAARHDAAVYTSRQQAAYAASGVGNSGSALAVEATTAGRLEQQIQQQKLVADQQAKQKRAAGAVGQLYGQAQANAIGIDNSANMLRGGASLLSTVGGAYQSGVFSGLTKPKTAGYDAAAKKGFLF